MKTVFKRFSVIIVVGGLFFVGSAEPGAVASAAAIAWGSAQNISGDSDVSTTGTLLYAYNIGPAGVGTTSVNGVSFAEFAFPVFSDFQDTATTATVSFVENPGTLVSFSNLGSNATPYSGLSGAYQTLLNGGASTTNPATVTVTLNGLTPGDQYLLQWWSSNAANRTGQFAESLQQTTAAATNQVTLDSNVTNADGGLGQFAIGTFTADASQQQFTLDSSPQFTTAPLINGFQVRAVPEPSTCVMALAGLACGGSSMLRRRKRTAA
jgi:hypothetical protein